MRRRGLIAADPAARTTGQQSDLSAVMCEQRVRQACLAAVNQSLAVCGAVPSPPPYRECSILLVGKQSDRDLLPRGIH
jgi:hypothetical protein